MYKHSDPFVDAVMYCDDISLEHDYSERSMDSRIEEIDEIVSDLARYGTAQVGRHHRTITDLIDELDCEFWQQQILPAYDFMATDPVDIITRHNTIVMMTIDRIREKLMERIK